MRILRYGCFSFITGDFGADILYPFFYARNRIIISGGALLVIKKIRSMKKFVIKRSE